jgi:16S rRNA (cytidine1402-2'-O)-methyltransferase
VETDSAKPSSAETNLVQGGTLYIVSTPIGNLQDISLRALDVLRSVDLILCEDTRHSLKLLRHYAIEKPLLSYHEHNERQRATEIVQRLREGQSVAQISDAGTPNLSDPGFPLVRACKQAGIPVVPIPGASALLAALVASGLPTNRFLYTGFLPPRSAARIHFLEQYIECDHTIAIYESCYRLETFIHEIGQVLGPQRWISVARELTKCHESITTGPQQEVLARLSPSSLRKGEAVVLIAPTQFTG